MPIQSPAWNDFLTCPVCCLQFDGNNRPPISLGCAHTLCAACLKKLHTNHCPFDQTEMNVKFSDLPINRAILSLMSDSCRTSEKSLSSSREYSTLSNSPNQRPHVPPLVPRQYANYFVSATECICKVALFLKPFGCVSNGMPNLNLSSSTSGALSRSMQRKLVTLINCQLVESEGRSRAIRAARSLGERTVTELILHHQNHHQLSANLWAAVRARGCQFLGPAMQEEVIRLVLLALEDGSALSRKVLVMFVVQRLEPHFPQASKTSIGHVVQLLYRASCFKVSKRERDSSLMQLKEEFRSYDSLRREHDTQIVQIATEAGLRIAPDQWSSLLYGDVTHKSHMQSIMDKLQTPQSFAQSVTELLFALHRTGDPGQLSELWPQLELLANLDSGGNSTSTAATAANNNADDGGIRGTTLADVGNRATLSISDRGNKTNLVDRVTKGNLVTSDRGNNRAVTDVVSYGSSITAGVVARDNSICNTEDINCGGGNSSSINSSSSWQVCALAMDAVHAVLAGLVHFLQHYSHRRLQDHHHHHYHGSRQQVPPHRPANLATVQESVPARRFEDDRKDAVCNTEISHDLPVGEDNDDIIQDDKSNIENCHDYPPPQIDHKLDYKHPDESATITPSYDTRDELPHEIVTPRRDDAEAQRRISENFGGSKIKQTPTKIYDSPNIVGVSHQAQGPFLSTPPTPPNLVHIPTIGPKSSYMHSTNTVFSSAEYGGQTYPRPPRLFNQQPAVFSSTTHHVTPVYPQPRLMTQELYPANAPAAQALLVSPIAPLNHATSVRPHMYNIMPPTMELYCPINKSRAQLLPPQQLLQPLPPQHIQSMQQQMMQPARILGPWCEYHPSIVHPEVLSQAVSSPSTPTRSADQTPTGQPHEPLDPTPSNVSKKSLVDLQEYKVSIMNRLVTIVGKDKYDEVEDHILKNQEHLPCVIPHVAAERGSSSPAFTSIYSIWTSGANFFSMTRASTDKDKAITQSVLSSYNDANPDDFRKIEMTDCAAILPLASSSLYSKFGPISRQPRAAQTPRPIQVSASNDVSSTTTSTLGTNYPLLSLSPMPHQALLYPSSGANYGFHQYGVYVSANGVESVTRLTTLQRDFVDPPHLRMSQLDPSGDRPSDPLDKHARYPGSKEERHRQQLNAVTDGIDPFISLKNMPEEHRLKQELSFVMHGIQEKLSVQEAQEDNATNNDMLQCVPTVRPTLSTSETTQQNTQCGGPLGAPSLSGEFPPKSREMRNKKRRTEGDIPNGAKT